MCLMVSKNFSLLVCIKMRTSKAMQQRRKRTGKRFRNFRFNHETDVVLVTTSRRFGWTLTRTIERALHFAAPHPDFGRSLEVKP